VRAVDADGDVESDPPDTPAPWQGSATRMTSMPLMGGDGSRRRTSRPVQSRCKKPSSATASGLAAGLLQIPGRVRVVGGEHHIDGRRRKQAADVPSSTAAICRLRCPGELESWAGRWCHCGCRARFLRATASSRHPDQQSATFCVLLSTAMRSALVADNVLSYAEESPFFILQLPSEFTFRPKCFI
jgi:hypothetical protein